MRTRTLTQSAKNRPALRIALLGSLAVAIACAEGPADEPGRTSSASFQWPTGPRPVAVLTIAGMGPIAIELFPEIAPRTVEHFTKLAASGFYAGTTFHRVLPGFMIQGGDPNTRDDLPSNDGEGGPGYFIEDEYSEAPHVRGVVSMANMGRLGTAGSQFFIVQQDSPHLDGKYTAFGRVASGLELVDAIAATETDAYGRWGPKNRPIRNVTIEAIEVRGNGAVAGTSSPTATPGRVAHR